MKEEGEKSGHEIMEVPKSEQEATASKKHRSPIVTFLAIVCCLIGVFLFFAVLADFSEIKDLVIIAIGIFLFILGYGLWKLREWARKVAMASTFILLLLVLWVDLVESEPGTSLLGLVGLLTILLAILWDLNTSDMKSAFTLEEKEKSLKQLSPSKIT